MRKVETLFMIAMVIGCSLVMGFRFDFYIGTATFLALAALTAKSQ
jgi:hypothetical protein